MAEEDKHDSKSKKKGALDKYKWWIVGGGGVLLVVVFMAVKNSNANSNSSEAANAAQTAAASTGAIDPDTGYLYGSPADLAALGEGSGSGSSEGTTGSTTTNNYYYGTSAGSTGTTGSGVTTTPAGTTLYANQQPGLVAYPLAKSSTGNLTAANMAAEAASSVTTSQTETPASLAAKFNSSPAAIVRANSGVISSSGLIHPGTRVAIPS